MIWLQFKDLNRIVWSSKSYCMHQIQIFLFLFLQFKSFCLILKTLCADIISVLGMTISDKRECLKYRFLSTKEDIGSWGHEYVRHLTAELALEWTDIEAGNAVNNITKDELFKLAEDIVQFYMKHNAEADACDLLMEIEQLDVLFKYVEKDTYQRVCLYLLGSV
jgi:26S proteasome regulatory subunit N1